VITAATELVKQRFRFVVTFHRAPQATAGGMFSARFRICTELSAELQKVVVRHGGSPLPFKMPGKVTFNDVTLERGATDSGRMFQWFAQAAVAGGAIGGTRLGKVGGPFRRRVTIIEQDRGRATLNRWYLANAFPVKFVAGEWDNESDDFTIESTTLTYDYFACSGLKDGPRSNQMASLASRL